MKIFLSFALLLLLFASPLFAQDSYQEFERGLELTEPQKIQIEGIRNRYIGQWHEVRRDLMRKRLDLQELSRDRSANSERIVRLQNEVMELQGARENIYNAYRSEVSRTLNEKQKERYNNYWGAERRRMRQPDMPPGRYGR
jgi:Spy/CpxP family protein refolding chaperone